MTTEAQPTSRPGGRPGTSDRLRAELAAVVGRENLVERPTSLKVYECDGYTLEKRAPELVVLPRTTGARSSRVVSLLADAGVAVRAARRRHRRCRAAACPSARRS